MQRTSTSPDERLVGVVDAGLRIVVAEPGLAGLMAAGRQVRPGASLLDLLDEPARALVLLAAKRVTREVLLTSPTGRGSAVLVRAAIVGAETWLMLYERRCGTGSGHPKTRRAALVGRNRELAELERYLIGSDLSVLYVRGPLGIGKTALLEAFAARCDDLECPYVILDARSAAPTGDAIAAALTASASQPPLDRILSTAERIACGRRWAVFVDNFDAWQELPDELADRPFCSLPLECRIVVAARRMPDGRWWDAAVRSVRLLNLGLLSPDEGAELQSRLGVGPEQADAVAARAKGHPLCIATLASASRVGLAPTDASMPLGVDYAKLGGRRLLETAAIPARVTEDVLAAILDEVDDAAEAYDTLTSLGVPDPSGVGLRIPDVVRESLRAGLRERSPARFTALQRRLVDHYADAIETRALRNVHPVLQDFFDSFDDHWFVRRLVGSRTEKTAITRRARPYERAALSSAAHRFVGEDAAKAIVRRFDRDLAITMIAEGPQGIVGLLQYVTPDAAALAQLAAHPDDEELTAAVDVLRSQTTLAADEHAIAAVAWATVDLARNAWGSASHALTRHLFDLMFTVPRNAATVFVQPATTVQLPTLTFPGAVLVASGARSVVYRDGRAFNARRVLLALLDAADDRTSTFHGASAAESQITVDAVRKALANLAHPDRLARTPLASLRIVSNDVGPGASPVERAEALARILRDAIAALEGGPRELKQREALEAVFLERSGKHEKIANDIGLTYSTFRRYLTNGVERVAAALRLREQAAR